MVNDNYVDNNLKEILVCVQIWLDCIKSSFEATSSRLVFKENRYTFSRVNSVKVFSPLRKEVVFKRNVLFCFSFFPIKEGFQKRIIVHESKQEVTNIVSVLENGRKSDSCRQSP